MARSVAEAELNEGMSILISEQKGVGGHPLKKTQAEFDDVSLTSRRMMIAGGFLDIALYTTNCEQLKFAMDSRALSSDTRYQLVIGLLLTSLTLQAIMGILFFLMGFFEESKHSQRRKKVINNIIMLLVAVVTLVNIVITTFSNKAEIAKYCMNMKKAAEDTYGDDDFVEVNNA